jgi:Protein of unknown function (DUF3866)
VPLSLRRGRITAVLERHVRLARVEVDGRPCVAYPRVTGPVALDDDVIVNVQARELALGSGGFDILYANLTRGLGLEAEPGAHVMTLPYTPLQHAVHHAEEEGELAGDLGGRPVVCCTLHSQLAPVCAGVGAGLRVAYIQVGGGALPVSLSDAVRALKGRGLVQVAVAAAPCFDADVQCVGIHSALAWTAASGFDAVVCSIGPGIVGTGTTLGHGGLAAATAAAVTIALRGQPVLAVRYSERDTRPRHRGVSHHARAVVGASPDTVRVAWPAGLGRPEWLTAEQVSVKGWEQACAGLPLDHMGRGPAEDPAFFAAAFAAGRLARRLAER